MSAIRLRSHGQTEEVRLDGDGAASIGTRSVAYRRTAEGAGTARIACSIFIASSASRASPAETEAPTRTKMRRTRPGIGAERPEP